MTVLDWFASQRSFRCDDCGAEVEFGAELDLRQAWYQLNDRGWVASRDRDGCWSHACPQCDSRRRHGPSLLDQPVRRASR
jgi:hypothetical protein